MATRGPDLLGRALLLALAGVVVACGTPVAAGSGESPDVATLDDTSVDDAAADLSAATDIAVDIAPDGPVTCGTLPGPDGCPCQSGNDCTSGACLETPNGLRCAAPCSDECPVGFACTSVTKAGGASGKVCASLFGNLCDPCKDNAACQEFGGGSARCLKNAGGGAFCGVSCKADSECPPGYGCQSATDVGGTTQKQCVFLGPGACACSQTAIASKLTTPCTITAGLAVCSGERACLGDGAIGAPKGGGLSACLASDQGAEQCDGIDNNCNGVTDEATCDDNEPCTTDACNNAGAVAKCEHSVNTLPCEADGSVCTVGDHCQEGSCQPGAPLKCDDNNLCTTDTCDPKTGCASVPADGALCDADGNGCTVGDACLASKCVVGTAKACATGSACVTASCDSTTGECVTGNADGAPCTDGNPCTLGETCKGGQCLGSASLCDDNNSCTMDVCDSKLGCLHSATIGPCDDGSVCTANDICGANGCVGVAQDVTLCDDNNACTTDSCDAKLGCVHPPANGAFCYDGDDCSVGDHCQGGQCVGSSNVCGCNTDGDCAKYDDGNPCNGVLQCDNVSAPTGCKLNPSTIISCSTAYDTPCAQNQCNSQTGQCAMVVKANGLVCNADDNLCTQGDACKDGACAPGLVPDCNDGNPCTTDACDPAKGCSHAFNDNPCNADSDACTDNDKCGNGVCAQGFKKICDDGEGCTYDSCDPTTGQCLFEGAKVSCSDNNLCTVGDVCAIKVGLNTWSCQPGTAAQCDDGNPCTADSCDPAKGCTYVVQTNVPIACYTGAAGTSGVGLCHGGTGQCDGNGVLGPCLGEQTPAAKDICDGLDNDCDGATDTGCAPTSFTARFATVASDGLSGMTMQVHSQFGSTWIAGAAPSAGSGPGVCFGALPFMNGKQLCW